MRHIWPASAFCLKLFILQLAEAWVWYDFAIPYSHYTEDLQPIYDANRTEFSPNQSVIMRVINKIGRPRSGNMIFLITSMITDRSPVTN
mgnify:CR=1 FL=1